MPSVSMFYESIDVSLQTGPDTLEHFTLPITLDKWLFPY
jgi:hypothetical protein